MLLMNDLKSFVLTLRTVILDKIKQNPQTIDQLFDTLNEKNNIQRHTIRGRLSELVKDQAIKKEGSIFSFIQ
jgi:predicted transcriptional regulator